MRLTKALADSQSMKETIRVIRLADGSTFNHATAEVSWQDFYRYTNKGETK
jgi:hypothetical protein